MRKVLLFLSISILWSVNLHAFEFQLKSSTTAPVFLGIGAAAQFDENWGIEAQIGQAPRVYAELIGNYAASSSGNSSYDDVIIAAFENNFIFKFGGFYKIQNGEGWKVATNFYLVTASGDADVDKVLSAATGKDYTNLKSFLVAAGKSTSVDMDSNLTIFEISGSYLWSFPSWDIEGIFGLAKIISSDVTLKTGLPNFEASNAGQNLLRSSESDLEDIIEENGLTPVIGIMATYRF